MSADTNGDDPRLAPLARLLGIVDRLRAPDGCPWDRKQTVESMAPYLVEEAHEAVEAIERAGELADGDTGGDAEIAEELGDVLMVACMIARIGEEAGRFDLARAAATIGDKLVRRHPHVFGDATADDADDVLRNWEAIKQDERKDKRTDASALAGVPVALPALQRADRLCGKAVSAGFRWTSVAGAIAKVAEEHEELRAALADVELGADREAPELPAKERLDRVGDELGDVLLSTAFLASYLRLDPEALCRKAARRFEARFRSMEAALAAEDARPLADHPLERLTAAWEAAKRALAAAPDSRGT